MASELRASVERPALGTKAPGGGSTPVIDLAASRPASTASTLAGPIFAMKAARAFS